LKLVNVWDDCFMPTTTLQVREAPELPLLSECCSPVVGQIIPASEAETLAARFKALADPTRLRLISLVAAHKEAEACVCELTDPVGLSQPTVSHHLKILVDAGILSREQRGKWAYYRLVPATLTDMASLIVPGGD
jgi:ArsR family transcriptional regulator, arsenate/arsenite/antimonite-responsive transcriptional repressor